MHVKIVGSVTEEFFEYAHRDHLGSIEIVTDENGNVLDNLAFEPFGSRKRKDWTANISATELSALLALDWDHPRQARGFTGHEHLDRTGFIHMNGRVYDPVLGRFLSPDPIVQFPTFSQSWNRYSYVSNTPTSLTDPSGFFGDDPPRDAVFPSDVCSVSGITCEAHDDTRDAAARRETNTDSDVGGSTSAQANARADVERAIESGILNPRGEWSSPGAVARDVLRVLDRITDKTGIEIGVVIFNPSKDVYTMGEIVYGDESSVMVPKPPGAVAGAHTHGSDPQYEVFSRRDVNWANGVDDDGFDLPGYENRPLPFYKSNGPNITVCNPGDIRCNAVGAQGYYRGTEALKKAVTGRSVP